MEHFSLASAGDAQPGRKGARLLRVSPGFNALSTKFVPIQHELRAMISLPRSRPRLGLSLIESVFVLIVAIGALSAGASIYSDHLRNQTNNAAAEHIKDVSEAFSRYILDNHQALIATVPSAGTRANIPINDLISGGYLPAGFTNRTPFNHEYVLTIRRPGAGNEIQGLLHTRYTNPNFALSQADAADISRMLGAVGGYTSTASPTTVTSTFGGYSLNLANFGVSPGAGAIVSAVSLAQAANPGDRYLHRSATGDPSHNRLHTSLDFNNNSINNANAVQGRSVSASNQLSSPLLISNRSEVNRLDATTVGTVDMNATNVNAARVGANTVSATTVAANGMTASTAAVDTMTASSLSATSGSIAALQTHNLDASGQLTVAGDVWAQQNLRVNNELNAWTLKGTELNVTGSVTLTGDVGIYKAVHEGDPCQWGMIGTLANGEIANCVNNKWARVGGASGPLNVATGTTCPTGSAPLAWYGNFCAGGVSTTLHGINACKYAHPNSWHTYGPNAYVEVYGGTSEGAWFIDKYLPPIDAKSASRPSENPYIPSNDSKWTIKLPVWRSGSPSKVLCLAS